MRPAESAKPISPSQPLRVLFVEDNPRDVKLTARVLEKAGYHLEFASVDTPELFQEQLEKADPQIIICDYNLRGWTAMDALDIARKLEKDIPFVVVSGSLGDEAAVECIKKGATDYVLKDRMARLPSAVGRALEEKVAHDQRKRTEDALRHSEERYRVVAETATDVIITIDEGSRILFVNKSAERIFGYTIPELLGRELTLLMPEYLRHLHRAGLKLYNETGKRHITWEATELPGLHKSGKEIPLEISFGEFVKDGKHIFTGVVRDITQRKSAEDKLRRSEEQFRLISENVADLIAVVDLEGRRVYNSPSYQAILGDPEELKGTLSFNEIHPDDRANIERVFEETVRTGVGQRAEYRFLLKGGSIRFIESQGSVIRNREGKPANVLVVSRDITERKKLEQQVLQSQKMEAIGQLAGGVAHDFNNLLTVISGFGQLAVESLAEGDPNRGNLQEVLGASDRAASLTRQLLAFSRRQTLQPKVLNLNEVVVSVEKMLRRLIGEDIELVSVPAPDLGRVKADPGQVEQVIMNLAVNARDAMPQGGKLTIETANVELDAAYSRKHPVARPGPHVMLAVTDTGSGMDEKTQARIFEPFFTTKEKGKGTGLGLSTVYGIVKQSDGNIWVYSEPGRGTSFKIYLPLVQEDAAPVKLSGTTPGAPRGTETILVVEDEGPVRRLVCAVLEANGYKLLIATRGDDALSLSNGHQGPIKLMLADLVMPGMSGRELADRLAPKRPEMKVLYMSGYTDDTVVRHHILDPDMPFLQKPFKPESLARKVREVLDATQDKKP